MNFINEEIAKLNLDGNHVVVCHQDGSLIFDSKELVKNKKFELLALVVGAISATEQIATHLSNDESPFTVSFANSSNGIYATPTMSKDGIPLYLILIFQGTLNPAPLKIKLRKLSEFLIENLKLKKSSGKKLFENITDEEIEMMFQGCKV